MESEISARIRECAAKPSSESARKLIRIHEESEWRSTRLEAVRALGHVPDSRALLFLIGLIRKNEDLSEQELAVRSLARHRTRGARMFLKSFYPTAPETLRPGVAHGLGIAQEFGASTRLLADWEVARKKDDLLSLKNMTLALGELKEMRSLEAIYELLAATPLESRDLLMACLFSLGRLERSPARIAEFEPVFSEETLLWQLYQGAVAQIQTRGQFKLEDYLGKIFDSENPHPALPLELRAFPEQDLLAGLELFPVEQFWKRHLLCLRALSPGLRLKLLNELLPVHSRAGFFAEISKLGDPGFSESEARLFFEAMGGESAPLELQLDWLDAFLPGIPLESWGERFLKSRDEDLSLRFLNLWSERSVQEDEPSIRRQIRHWAGLSLSDALFSRLLRASAEIGVTEETLEEAAVSRWKSPACRASILFHAERHLPGQSLDRVLSLDEKEWRGGLGVQGLAILSLWADARGVESVGKTRGETLRAIACAQKTGSREHQVELCRWIARWKAAGAEAWIEPRGEPWVEAWMEDLIRSEDPVLRLNAVIAAKNFPAARPLSEALAELLEGADDRVIQGRALDSILAHSTLVARRAALRFLKEHISDEFVVDKLYRDFDPKKSGGAEFYDFVSELLQKHPEHPQWEKLVALRDRLKPAPGAEARVLSPAIPELNRIDDRLRGALPGFDQLEPAAKLALRAAEEPFQRSPETGHLPIDKAPIVLEFCKALDLLLERELGQKILFPRIERGLHEFQVLWQRAGFGEEYPQADRVMARLGLEGRISHEHFPLHKAKLMSAAFFNGRILQDRFKIFDGLRAWAVILLVFARKIPGSGQARPPLLSLSGLEDETCVRMAIRLMRLQDLRNPAAHRQTYASLDTLEAVREDALTLMLTVQRAFRG